MAAAMNVRGLDPRTVAAVKAIGGARGWSQAETVDHIVAFVLDAQRRDEYDPTPIAPLLEQHGLTLVSA